VDYRERPHIPRRVLRRRDCNEDVRQVQTWLNLLSDSQRIVADGRFGPLTERMLKRFQESRGLVVTGQVDLETWIILEEAVERVLVEGT
jgi:peptidoglycan hydrolase-like protein with peptidoglycan-binding domain